MQKHLNSDLMAVHVEGLGHFSEHPLGVLVLLQLFVADPDLLWGLEWAYLLDVFTVLPGVGH